MGENQLFGRYVPAVVVHAIESSKLGLGMRFTDDCAYEHKHAAIPIIVANVFMAIFCCVGQKQGIPYRITKYILATYLIVAQWFVFAIALLFFILTFLSIQHWGNSLKLSQLGIIKHLIESNVVIIYLTYTIFR